MRPHYQHQMALLELADSMALGHLFTDWVSRPPAGLHSPNLTPRLGGGVTEPFPALDFLEPSRNYTAMSTKERTKTT